MGHGSIMNHGPSFAGGNHGRGSFTSIRRPRFSSSPHRSYRRRSFYSVSPWFSYGFPGYYAYPYYDDYDNSADAYPSYSESGSYDDQSARMEQDKVDRLEDEVAQLREERNTTRQSSPARVEIRASTVLVFHDQHTQEVRNYAIVGETLWVFDAQKATKIAVSDLDVAATTKANDDRGVDFRLPD